MKYQVVARYYVYQEIVDQVIVDDYEEAADLACNWQSYYDGEYEWTGNEVFVAVYEIEDESEVK